MVFERLSRALKKLPFSILEPTIPVFTAYLLNRELEKWENEDSILNHKIKAGRIGKRHYTLELEITLTKEQARKRISNLSDELPSVIRR